MGPKPRLPGLQDIHGHQNSPVLMTAVTEEGSEMFASSSFCSVLLEFSATSMYYTWRHGHKEQKEMKSKVILATAMSIGRWR